MRLLASALLSALLLSASLPLVVEGVGGAAAGSPPAPGVAAAPGPGWRELEVPVRGGAGPGLDERPPTASPRSLYRWRDGGGRVVIVSDPADAPGGSEPVGPVWRQPLAAPTGGSRTAQKRARVSGAPGLKDPPRTIEELLVRLHSVRRELGRREALLDSLLREL